MPIYEFTCESCSRTVELLVRDKNQQPECPDCGSSQLRRRHSLIAAPKKSGDACPGGRCGLEPGSCGLPAEAGGCASGLCGL